MKCAVFAAKLLAGRGQFRSSNVLFWRRPYVKNVSSKIDYYEILGVKKNASQDEIKAAYYELSKQLHPDATPGAATEDEKKFVLVNEAYEILGNVNLRRQYDEGGSVDYDSIFSGPRDSPPPQEHAEFHSSRLPRSKAVDRRVASSQNFDEWTKTVYSQARKDAAEGKHRYSRQQKAKEIEKFDTTMEVLIVLFLIIGFTLLSTSFGFSFIGDEPPAPKKKKDK